MKTGRAVWAINPFDVEMRVMSALGNVIRNFWPQATVLPVYVASPADVPVNASLEGLDDGRGDSFADLARSVLKEKLIQAGFAELVESVAVTFEPSLSQKSLVRNLVEYARKADADFIAVSTHARIGMDRWFLGSFAESLSHLSSLPALIINPEVGRSGRLQKLFFSSDLGPLARKGFEESVQIAQDSGADVIYYHKIQPHIDSVNGLALVESDLLDRSEELRKIGTNLRMVMDDGSGGVAEGIIRHARDMSADLIVIQGSLGPVQTMLLGSVSRRVIRESPLPVLILKGS